MIDVTMLGRGGSVAARAASLREHPSNLIRVMPA
jgi:hypothetical protein